MDVQMIQKDGFEVTLNQGLFQSLYTLSMDNGEKIVKVHLSDKELLKVQKCINDFVSIRPELQYANTNIMLGSAEV